jgi:hypothetical protein
VATTPHSQLLRTRAAALRKLSAALDSSRMIDLHRRAGEDVWLGPTASRCRDDLQQLARTLATEAADLVVRARTLEQRADVIESVAAAPAVGGF